MFLSVKFIFACLTKLSLWSVCVSGIFIVSCSSRSLQKDRDNALRKNLSTDLKNRSVLVFSPPKTEAEKLSETEIPPKKDLESKEQKKEKSASLKKNPLSYSGNYLVREKKFHELSGKVEAITTVTGNAQIRYQDIVFKGNELEIIGNEGNFIRASKKFTVEDLSTKSILMAEQGYYIKELDLLIIDDKPELKFIRQKKNENLEKDIVSKLKCQRLFRLISATLNYCPGQIEISDEELLIQGGELWHNEKQGYVFLEKDIQARWNSHLLMSRSFLMDTLQNNIFLGGPIRAAVSNPAKRQTNPIKPSFHDPIWSELRHKLSNQDWSYFFANEDYMGIAAANFVQLRYSNQEEERFFTGASYFSLSLPQQLQELVTSKISQIMKPRNSSTEADLLLLENLKNINAASFINRSDFITDKPALKQIAEYVYAWQKTQSWRAEFLRVKPEKELMAVGNVMLLSQTERQIYFGNYLFALQNNKIWLAAGDFNQSQAFMPMCAILKYPSCFLEFEAKESSASIPGDKFLHGNSVFMFNEKNNLEIQINAASLEFNTELQQIRLGGSIHMQKYSDNQIPLGELSYQWLSRLFIGNLQQRITQVLPQFKATGNWLWGDQKRKVWHFAGLAEIQQQESVFQAFNWQYDENTTHLNWRGPMQGNFKP